MALRSIFVLVVCLITLNFAVAKEAFEQTPAAAVVNLKITSPKKPVRSGYVFVNGEYIQPPYRVVRYGTVIKINGKQVTGQVVPWKRFTNSAAAPSSTSSAPRRTESVKKTTKSAVTEISALDALFDDAPAVSISAPSSSNEPEETSSSTSSASEDSNEEGEFVKDARTKALLLRINNYRNTIHRHLMDGGVYFFGVEYSQIYIPGNIAPGMLDVMVKAIKDSPDADSLHQLLRAKGYPFICKELCSDLLSNAVDTTKITERRRKDRSKEDTRSLINKAASGNL
ncbi:MAG: hypothetical protein J6V88_05000 [Kiritimatiellae bacterium]|nr:hypothetical protein [Kiritimatiellia bacterium]